MCCLQSIARCARQVCRRQAIFSARRGASRAVCIALLLAAGAFAFGTRAAHAQTQYWDPNLNGTDGGGYWDTSPDALWSPNVSGGMGDVDWTNGDTADFGYSSGGGAITLTTGITAAGIQFNTDTGSFTFGGSQTLALGTGQGTSTPAAGTLTLQSGAITSFTLPLTQNTSTPLISAGTLTALTGTVTVDLSGSPALGTYDLIGYGSGPGTASTAANFTLGASVPAGYSYTLSTVGVSGSTYGQLDLTVASAATPITWTGYDGGNGAKDDLWSTGTQQNWYNGSAAAPYTDGSPVTFSDSNPAGGSAPDGKVYIADGGVNPLSVTFSNTSVP